MRYIDHIRQMNDGQLAYFLNMLRPYIPNWTIALERAESDSIPDNGKHPGIDPLYGLNADARRLLSEVLYADYEEDIRDIENSHNKRSSL